MSEERMVDGVGVGSLAGMRAADAASGPPAKMVVGADASTVYRFCRAHRARR